MPQIVVKASGAESPTGAVLLRERVAASDLESEAFTAHLLKRISRALSDADTLERPRGPQRGSARHLGIRPPARPPAG